MCGVGSSCSHPALTGLEPATLDGRRCALHWDRQAPGLTLACARDCRNTRRGEGVGGLRLSPSIRTTTPILGVAAVLGFIANAAIAQSVQGPATYRERIALPSGAVFEAALEDITRGDTSADTIQTTPANPAGGRPLEGTHWKAIELAGKPTPTQDSNREAHLLFLAGGRVSGSDGCNRITGNYQLTGDAITFGQMIGTQMACIDRAAETERAFREALKSAARLAIAGDRLELSDATGKRVAVFATVAQASSPSTSSGLPGTSWQLVKFQGSDGTTLTPDDGGKYTIEFVGGGGLTARIDCNRGRGSWESSGSNQIQFGPLALTRAKCPPGSLHDQIVKQWRNIRSYVMKNGHLFLSLMADGGIYEFEPVTKAE